MFDDYLDAIDASDVIRTRVNNLYVQYTKLVPASRVPHILITDSLSDDQQFDALWIYGADYVAEYKSFQTEDRFDGFKVGGVTRWEISTKSYSLGESPRSRSKMSLYWRWAGIDSLMAVTGDNCSQLEHFFRTAILPHDLDANQ